MRKTLTAESETEPSEDDCITLGPPLDCQACDIDETCVGEKWVSVDDDRLAALIAIVAMGQAAQASHIIENLVPAEPAYTFDVVRNEAKIKLTVQDPPSKPRAGYPQWQRDGFVFEVISWIAAKITHGDQALLNDPHLDPTSHGLDGFMLQLSNGKNAVESSTIFEDKCTDDPTGTFRNKVIPGFLDHHKNVRSAEIIQAAGALLRSEGLAHKDVARLSAEVMDISKRKYRAAFSLPSSYDTLAARQNLFAHYDRIKNIDTDQRIGASLITSTDMRAWIAARADKAVMYLDNLEGEKA